MSLQSVAGIISAKCFFDELHVSRVLGHDAVMAYDNAMSVQDAVYAAAFAEDRPWVWDRPRIVTGRRA